MAMQRQWPLAVVVVGGLVLGVSCSKAPERAKPVESPVTAAPESHGKFAPLYAAASAVGKSLGEPSGVTAPGFRKDLDAFKLAIQDSMPLSKSESEDDLMTLFIAAHMRAEEAARAVDTHAPDADAAIASAKRAVAKATAAELPR
jgi:hypothetical protein